jgi:hypothetical protein
MQVQKFFIAAFLFTIALASCKKSAEDVQPTVVSIEGKWVGKSSVLSEPFINFYSFNIKAGGVLERLDANGAKIGEGTWAFYSNNTAITGTYTITGGATFSIIANFDNVAGKLDGTWGNGTNDYNGGYWFLNKTN